jgi:hypothetical protein
MYSAQSQTGNKQETAGIVCKLLNHYIADRTIPKQEAMCELGRLPMVICSENIEMVSLSGALRCRGKETNNGNLTFLSKYENREKDRNMSLHRYFLKIKNVEKRKRTTKELVPHYVGGSGQPMFPVTQNYARASLLVHYPWSKTNPLPFEEEYVPLFEAFVESDECPASLTIPYQRVKLRVEQKKCYNYEPHSPDQEESTPTDGIEAEDVLNALALTETMADNENLFEELKDHQINYGKQNNWRKRRYEDDPVSLTCL